MKVTTQILILGSIFATAQAASLAARHEGHSHSEPEESVSMDHGDMNMSGCQTECHALVMMADQCGTRDDSEMVTCPCSPELMEAMQDCQTCVEAQGDSLEDVDVSLFQDSLTNYTAQCSANGTTSASPSAASIAATLFAPEFAAAETVSPAAESDTDSSAFNNVWSTSVGGVLCLVAFALI